MKEFKVSDSHRQNPLSLTPGGSQVSVTWEDGTTLHYDKVKHPQSYVASISNRESARGRIVAVAINGTLVWKSDTPSSSSWWQFLSK
jgi:hypothetical protein